MLLKKVVFSEQIAKNYSRDTFDYFLGEGDAWRQQLV